MVIFSHIATKRKPPPVSLWLFILYDSKKHKRGYMDKENEKPAESNASPDGDSLETTDNAAVTSGRTSADSKTAVVSSARPQGPLLKRLLGKVNVYLLLFIVVMIVMGIVFAIAFLAGHSSPSNKVKTQTLTSDTLKQLANSDVTVGQPKQVLNVQSNAVFAGKVLVRDSLEVAGTIQVGGILNVPGINVSGNSVLDQAQINKTLTVGGDAGVQGQLAVQKGLAVTGSGTFGGNITAPQLSVNVLQLNGDLNLTHHITAGGATPSRSNGSALGGGGSASISGSDTAGTINVNTGGGASAGCFISVTFAQKFNATPHVLVTPIGASAGAIGYYVNRSITGFSVCAADTPPSGASFAFDYFVLD